MACIKRIASGSEASERPISAPFPERLSCLLRKPSKSSTLLPREWRYVVSPFFIFILVLVLPFGKNAVGLGLAENNDRYITRNVVVMNSYGDRRTMPKSKKSVASSSNWHSKTGAFTNWRSNSNVTKILLSATRRRDGQSSWQASKHHRPAFPGQFRGRLTLKSRHSFSIRVVYKLCKESVIRPSFFLFFFFFRFKLVCVLR